MTNFQSMVRQLSHFWEKQGCTIHQGYDLEVGAGTFNPATFLRALGPEPYNAAYVEPSRRPTDGRYGTNPNRLQHYFQFQVVLKPSPSDIQTICLQSLEAIGFKLSEHDIRFVHDDWESPTLGAWGLGWEVWVDGMELIQVTYFQQLGGIDLKPVTGEITYGLERLAMYLQKVDSVYDLRYDDQLTYGDIYHRNEVEWSHYNFEEASTEMWLRHFEDYEKEAKRLINKNLPIPAYDFVAKASHAFNMLDARGVISVTERTGYIARIRDLACLIAKSYIENRETQNFPLLKNNRKETSKALALPKIDSALLTADTEKRENFLLEVGSEELPATFVPIGLNSLEKNVKSLLEKEGIPFRAIKTFATPRRLAIYIEDLALCRPPQFSEKKGPSLEQAYDMEGKIKPAGDGFFRSINLTTPTMDAIKSKKVPGVELRNVKGVDYLYATLEAPSKPTAEILAEQLPKTILSIDFPKKMRWADLDISYARPLLWIVCLLGKYSIPFQVGNILSGNTSYGHRQLCPASFTIDKPENFVDLLKKHQVMVDIEERNQSIISQLDALEKKLDKKIIAREKVLPQVLNLVEWPLVTTTDFKKDFLRAPQEVLISEMVEHQKYFPVTDKQGTLVNFFVITANNNPSPEICHGNLKVLSARLSDGIFLYEQDLKVPLEQFNEKLKHMTFQKELGSVYDKVMRIKAHSQVLHRTLNIDNFQKIERAALLCKADLASEMVYEFPELQGIIGSHYALKQGEDPEVAQAIDEHWMPRGENAPLPQTDAGFIVSFADKIDNLLGCFAVGLKPTSSSDPYALRRQVLGIIKMVIERKCRLPLKDILTQCLKNFPKVDGSKAKEIVQEIETFITNRIKTVFLDYGFDKAEIEASLSFGFSDIYDTFCKVQALHNFRKNNPNFPLLLEVYKRAKGQLAGQTQQVFSPKLLQEPAEKDLDKAILQIDKPFNEAIASQKYDQAYACIATLQPALASLFDHVKILADDPALRSNRLGLLQRVFSLSERLLDFSKLL